MFTANGIGISLFAFVLSIYGIRKILHISKIRKLFDEPTEQRKIHSRGISNLGGVAIFISIIITCLLFVPFDQLPGIRFIAMGGLILFLVGLTDDLVGLNSIKKFVMQAAISCFVILGGKIGLKGIEGLFGIYELPVYLCQIVSVFLILLLINAMNLIDGINGLAGSVGFCASLVFAIIFWSVGEIAYMLISLSLSAALAGFLCFNLRNGKIFMGDSGALTIGFMLAIFSLKYFQLFHQHRFGPGFSGISPVCLLLATLIVPVFDTMRVFTLRLLKGKSPFLADRNHVHHRLIEINLSHLQASIVLIGVTLASLGILFLFRETSAEIVFVLLISFALMMNGILGRLHYRRFNGYRRPRISQQLHP